MRKNKNTYKHQSVINRVGRSSRQALLFSVAFALLLIFVAVAVIVHANSQVEERLVQQKKDPKTVRLNINDERTTVKTNSNTVGELLKEKGIDIKEHDVVEPDVHTSLPFDEIFEVDVYIAKLAVIIDGDSRIEIYSIESSPKKIIKQTDIKIHPKDRIIDKGTEELSEGEKGRKLVIKRAKEIKLVDDGEITKFRTQVQTVGEMLSEESITLGVGDGLSIDRSTKLKKEMTIEIWRSNTQTISVTENIDFSVETVKDPDRWVGYKKIKTPGEKGKRKIIYEVLTRNGREISRTHISSEVIKQPTNQVVVIGTKEHMSFSEALAELRQCESGGNYQADTGNGYYGAYQFNEDTWQTNAPDKYKDDYPHQAPPSTQDEAATNLYNARGWQPWPSCAKNIPLHDIYR